MNKTNNSHSSSDEEAGHDVDGDDSDIDDEHMDETDFTKRNNMDNKRRNIICCGENNVQIKSLKGILQRRTRVAGPGQAVQVITNQRGTQLLNDNEEKHSKKMKADYGQV